MNFLIIILLSSTLSIPDAPASSVDLAVYRNEVFGLNSDSRKAVALYDRLNSYSNLNPTMIAYKGVAAAHIAKISNNPFEKWSMLRKANKYFDTAVKEESDNIEIRFLRYATQLQIPRILGMSDNINEDQDCILENYNLFRWDQIAPEICRYIFNFMIEQGECSTAEKELLRQKSMLATQRDNEK